MVIDDMDNGIKDILICGNTNDAAVMVGNIDAAGAQLLGTGKGNFVSVSSAENGLTVRGEVRRIVYLKDKKVSTVILLKNNDAARYLCGNDLIRSQNDSRFP